MLLPTIITYAFSIYWSVYLYDEETAAILHVEPGFPLLVITRVSFDANGIPREYGVWKYRSNLYYLEMSLVK